MDKTKLQLYKDIIEKLIVQNLVNFKDDKYISQLVDACNEIDPLIYKLASQNMILYPKGFDDEGVEILPFKLFDLSEFIEIIKSKFMDPESKLDIIKLNLSLKHSSLSAFRIVGDSMINSGVHNNDLLVFETIFDKNNINSSDIYLIELKQQFYVKHIIIDKANIILRSANPDYPDFEIKDPNSLNIVGKCLFILKSSNID